MAQYFIVSIDFDGVLAHGVNVKRKYTKEWFGVDLALDQTKEIGFEELMKSLGKNIKYSALMGPLNEQHIMEYEIRNDCLPVLTQLFDKGYRFVVITSRNDHDYPYAKAFLKEHFGGLIKYVHNTRFQSKGMFVGRIKPRVHIDDDISKLLELADYPIELIYFRQPENDGQEIPLSARKRIYEVTSFTEVNVILERIRFLHDAICKKENIPNTWPNVPKIYSILHTLSENEVDKLLAA